MRRFQPLGGDWCWYWIGCLILCGSLWAESRGCRVTAAEDVSASVTDSDAWQCGVAKVKITPEAAMPMAGYASRGSQLSQGTLNDLYVKSLLLQDSHGRRGLLITMDLCGIGRELAASLHARLAEELDLQPHQILLSVSHTHSGPVVANYLRPLHYALLEPEVRQLVDQYTQDLIERIVQSAVQARDAMQPCRLAHGMGHVTFATNRRDNPSAEVPARRAAGTLVGPVDYSLPVLAIYHEDRLIASVFGYACHCTTLSGMQWSSDYAGFAQDLLELERPGCIAMFWAGCGADQNPLPRGTLEHARQYGRELADGVQDVLAGVMETIEPTLEMKRSLVELPFDTLPTESQLELDSQSENIYTAARGRMLLEQIRSGEPLSPSYPYPVATWSLGKSVDWIALGGEVVVDYSLALRSLHAGRSATWVMGYANDVMAYIPSRRVLAEGGYEGGGAMVYYGLPTRWAPDIEKIILDEVQRQLPQ